MGTRKSRHFELSVVIQGLRLELLLSKLLDKKSDLLGGGIEQRRRLEGLIDRGEQVR